MEQKDVGEIVYMEKTGKGKKYCKAPFFASLITLNETISSDIKARTFLTYKELLRNTHLSVAQNEKKGKLTLRILIFQFHSAAFHV